MKRARSSAPTFSSSSLSQIIRCHWPALEIEPCFTSIPTGKFNDSYWVELDEQTVVLRVAPPPDATFLFYERNMMRQEPQLHALILAETAVPVPRVLAFDASRKLIGRDYIIMERMPGRPLTTAGIADENEVFSQIGAYLAQVHRLHATLHGYLGPHEPMPPQVNWVDAFAIMWGKLIDDVVSVGYYDDEESTFMRQLLDYYLEIFDRPLQPSLLHMDVWHQNILVDGDGKVSGLIDWDRALWGDPEIEFAVLDYCGISTPAFWEGYGCERDSSVEAKTRKVFYLLYELQKYIVIRHGRQQDPSGAHRYKQQVLQILYQHLL